MAMSMGDPAGVTDAAIGVGYDALNALDEATLYRFFDAGGRLLYVGVTSAMRTRLRAHSYKTWWPNVATATFEHFDTRQEVLAAEKRAIQAEHPLHNIAHAEPEAS